MKQRTLYETLDQLKKEYDLTNKNIAQLYINALSKVPCISTYARKSIDGPMSEKALRKFKKQFVEDLRKAVSLEDEPEIPDFSAMPAYTLEGQISRVIQEKRLDEIGDAVMKGLRDYYDKVTNNPQGAQGHRFLEYDKVLRELQRL
jgi:hypothetical protein